MTQHLRWKQDIGESKKIRTLATHRLPLASWSVFSTSIFLFHLGSAIVIFLQAEENKLWIYLFFSPSSIFSHINTSSSKVLSPKSLNKNTYKEDEEMFSLRAECCWLFLSFFFLACTFPYCILTGTFQRFHSIGSWTASTIQGGEAFARNFFLYVHMRSLFSTLFAFLRVYYYLLQALVRSSCSQYLAR